VSIRFSLTNLIRVKITGLKNPTYSFVCVWVANTECSETALKLKHPEGLTRYYHCSFDAVGQSETWWGRFHLTLQFTLYS